MAFVCRLWLCPRTYRLLSFILAGMISLPSAIWAGQAAPAPGAVTPPATGDISQTPLPPLRRENLDPIRWGTKMSAEEAELSRERCRRANYIVKQANGFNDESRLTVQYFKQALDLCPGHPEANFRMGVISYHQKETDAAIDAFQRSIKSDQDFVDGYYNLGIIYRKRKNPAKAREFFKKAVRIDPKDALSLYNLGVLQYSTLERLKAQESFERSIESNPDLAEPHFFLGAMYQERGERQIAKRELQTTLRLNPKLALPRVFLSAILETEGESSAAQRELDQAIAINPASVNVGYGLEEFYFKEGKSNGILTHIRARKKRRTEMQITNAEPASEIESTAPDTASKSAAGESGGFKPASETLSSRKPESEMPGGRMEGGEAKEEIVSSEQGREAQEIQKIEKTESKLRAGAPGVYRVRARDTVAKIARRYGTTVAVLMGLNTTRIEHPTVLDVGTNIRVPAKKIRPKKRRRPRKAARKKRSRRRSANNIYRIKRGDTLTKVARRYKTSVKTLMRLNRTVIEHPDLLEAGMRIKVPRSRKSNSKARKKKSARKKRRPAKRTVKKSTDTLSTVKRTRTEN